MNPSIQKIARSHREIGLFLELADRSGLVHSWTADKLVTLFAPTDEAMIGLDWSRQTPEELQDFITAHAAPGALTRRRLRRMARMVTLAGTSIDIRDGVPFRLGSSRMVEWDILVDRLLVHVLDERLPVAFARTADEPVFLIDIEPARRGYLVSTRFATADFHHAPYHRERMLREPASSASVSGFRREEYFDD